MLRWLTGVSTDDINSRSIWWQYNSIEVITVPLMSTCTLLMGGLDDYKHVYSHSALSKWSYGNNNVCLIVLLLVVGPLGPILYIVLVCCVWLSVCSGPSCVYICYPYTCMCFNKQLPSFLHPLLWFIHPHSVDHNIGTLWQLLVSVIPKAERENTYVYLTSWCKSRANSVSIYMCN